MAVSLLQCVGGEVAAEQVQRFLGHAERTAVRGGADDAGAGEIIDNAFDCGVHVGWFHDLVADQPAFWAVTVQPAFVHDGLACNAFAGKTRQPHIGRTRNDAFLARGQAQESAACRQHIIHRQQILAVAADGELFDHGDPWLLDGLPVHVVRRHVLVRDAAEEFVDDAQVALQIPDERHLAVVQMGEVDAAAEHAFAVVFSALHVIAAQYTDLGLRIEDRKVDGDLRRIDRSVVFGIEMARIFLQHVRRVALAGDFGGAEVEVAGPFVFGKLCDGFRSRQEHGMAQVCSGARIGKYFRNENPLVDFVPFLVALHERQLGVDLGVCGRQAGNQYSRVINQLFDAYKARAIARQSIVERARMGRKKTRAHFARDPLDVFRSFDLSGVA